MKAKEKKKLVQQVYPKTGCFKNEYPSGNDKYLICNFENMHIIGEGNTKAQAWNNAFNQMIKL